MTQPPGERPTPRPWTPPPAAPHPPAWMPPQAPRQPQSRYPQGPYQQAPYPPQGEYPPSGYRPQPDQDPTVFTPQPPASPKRRVPLIASAVAVVALVAGGAITYVALSDSSSTGAASPQEAVQKAVVDLQNSDVVGLLDDLAPGERDALANPVRDDVQQLKDLHVLDPGADPSKVSGVTVTARNLTYGDKPLVVNDHVQIVQLTSGTIDITGDTSKIPFSEQFRSTAKVPSTKTTQHLNLADDGPVRIATVEIGDRWYPSIFYTAADDAARHRLPSPGDAIPAVGSDSAQDAVRDEVNALLKGDVRTALAHVSPAELGAVHDYGGMLLDAMPRWSDPGIKITRLDLTTSSLAGGATRVGLKKLSMSKDGSAVSIAIDGSCASVSAQRQTHKFCADDMAGAMSSFFGAMSCSGSGSSGGTSQENCAGARLSQAQKTALADLFTGFTKLGIATTQTDGKWYVNPIRSAADVYGTLLGGLKGNDLLELLKLAR